MLEVKLHDIGEGITEGEIIQYLVQEGEQVMSDQPLVEIQTDKVVAELPAPSSGLVKKILVPPGQSVHVGTTLMYIETAEAQVALQAEEHVETKIEKTPSKPTTRFKRVLATPYTRKIAREHHINIEEIPATDPSGRVTEEDVHRFIRERESTERESRKHDQTVHTASPTESQALDEIIPFRGIRKQIAQKMSQSVYTIPHVTMFEEVDLTNLLTLREELKAVNLSISVTAFLIKALVQALKDFPIFNARLDEKNETIILKKEYHIGLATDTKDGLLVPVLQHAQTKSIKEIHAELKELTAKAKHGSLSPLELQQGTFTVSNVGPLGGGLFATPIINYPETALIAFHQTKKRPMVNEHDQIVIRQMMNLSFSFDHRLADGASAIRFIQRFSKLIEQPYTLMLELM